MPHFFIETKNINGSAITINDAENYRHIAKSLRIKCGEKLLLVDEQKFQYETIVKQVTSKEIVCVYLCELFDIS